MAEQFLVSARKYRPDSFSDLLGQDAISITLRRAIKQKKTAHAYLFCGPRGVGKTSAARIFAKTINCLSPTEEGEACNACESCLAFNEQRSINIFELDAASNNSTDDIRRLIEEVSVPPQFGNYKVYIIDEVHMLSQSAFNAFLKTLEEPPSYVIFILATTEKQKILPTILSRCQVYDFKPISVDKIQEQLRIVAASEGFTAEEKALELIAKHADGGMRDALSLFDRIASFGNGTIAYQATIQSLHILGDETYLHFAQLIYNNDASSLLFLLDEVVSKGFDPKSILIGLQDFFRKLMLAADNTTLSIAAFTEEEKPQMVKLALDFGRPFIFQALMRLAEAEKRYRTSSSKRLLLEMTLLSLTSLSRVETAEVSPRASAKPVTQRQQLVVSSAASSTSSDTLREKEKTLSANPTVSSSSPQWAKKRSRVGSVVLDLKELEEKKNPDVKASSTNETTFSPNESKSEIGIPSHTQGAEFTNENLQRCWQRFAETTIPKQEVMLRNAFKSRKPEFIATDKIRLEVVSESQQTLFNKVVPQLVYSIKQEFALESLSFEIEVSSEGSTELLLSHSEWFAQEKEKNKALSSLVEQLELREV